MAKLCLHSQLHLLQKQAPPWPHQLLCSLLLMVRARMHSLSKRPQGRCRPWLGHLLRNLQRTPQPCQYSQLKRSRTLQTLSWRPSVQPKYAPHISI
jgi:hypothetical protein